MKVVIVFIIFTGWLFLAAKTGFKKSRQSNGWVLWDRLLVLLSPLLTVTVFGLLIDKVYNSLFVHHNWSRLQKTFAFAKGFPIYYPQDSGPIMVSLYGPVSVLTHVPAAWIPHLEFSMMIAAFLNVIYFFVPVLWLHFIARDQDKESKAWSLFAFLCFACIPVMTSSLRNAAFNLHADAQTLGLCAFACAPIFLRKNGGTLKSLLASAVFAVLAVWSKQVAVPILPAIALYLFLSEGGKVLFQYVAVITFVGLCVSGVFILWFGFDELFFNMFVLPGSHPLRSDGSFQQWGHAFFKIMRESIPMFIIGFFSWGPMCVQEGAWRTRQWWHENRWVLFIMIGIFMIPISMLSYSKMGGSNNTLSYTNYFFLIAATLGFLFRQSIGGEVLVQKSKRTLIAIGFVLLSIQIPTVYYRIFTSPKKFNYARVGYDYAKKHPGEIYFPTIPLVNLIAEEKIYHDVIGLMDRDWADMKVSSSHLAAHLPEKLNKIAFPKDTDNLLSWIPVEGFGGQQETPKELPGFWVYSKRS